MMKKLQNMVFVKVVSFIFIGIFGSIFFYILTRILRARTIEYGGLKDAREIVFITDKYKPRTQSTTNSLITGQLNGYITEYYRLPITFRNAFKEEDLFSQEVFVDFEGNVFILNKEKSQIRVNIYSSRDVYEYILPLKLNGDEYDARFINLRNLSVVLAIGVGKTVTVYRLASTSHYMPYAIKTLVFDKPIVNIRPNTANGFLIYTAEPSGSEFLADDYRNLTLSIIEVSEDFQVIEYDQIDLKNIYTILEPVWFDTKNRVFFLTELSPYEERPIYIIDFRKKTISQLSVGGCKIESIATGVNLFYIKDHPKCAYRQGFYAMQLKTGSQGSFKLSFLAIPKNILDRLRRVYTGTAWRTLIVIGQFSKNSIVCLEWGKEPQIYGYTKDIGFVLEDTLPGRVIDLMKSREYAIIITNNSRLPWIDLYFPRPGIILRIYRLET